MNMPTDAFLTALYTLVDDWYQEYARPLLAGKVGKKPLFSDSEVITLSLAQHWLRFPSEREWLRFIHQNYRPLFPRLISQSEYNRRTRRLTGLMNTLRRWLAQQADASTAGAYLIDGTPLHVRHWRRYGPRSLALPGAALGFCASKKETFYGYRLVLLLTLDGRLLDFVLLPGNADERIGLVELLEQYRDFQVMGDKGFIDGPRLERLRQRFGHRVWTPKRSNQQEQNPKEWDRLCRKLRQRVETAIDQAKDYFGLEKPGAKTFQGLGCRLLAQLTGLTLANWINRLQGRSPLALADFSF